MPTDSPMCGRRRGRHRRFWILLVLLPVVLFLLANLWCVTPMGRRWIAGGFQRVTGLETRVGGGSVSPWHGISIDQVELLQPVPLRSSIREPLATIKHIRLVPVWRAWLRGRRELRSIELDSPHCVVPAELLAELARSHTPAGPVAPPVIAAVTPAVPVPTQPQPPSQPQPPQPPQPPQHQAVPVIPETVLPPTVWLHLKNASFTLISAASGKKWIDLSGVEGSIPISGTSALSKLRIHSLRAAGQDVLADIDASLEWKTPVLSLKPLEITPGDFKVLIAGKIGMLSGLPLQLEFQLPQQKLRTMPLANRASIAAGQVSANARFRGLLLAPGTWQGDLVAEAAAPSAHIGDSEVKFDRGSAVTVLRGGLLSCVDARMIGDDLSLLGNGTLLADGRIAAALRLVALPDHVSTIVRRVFPDLPEAPSLLPLSTPQRSAFDLEVFGNIAQPYLKLGHEGPVIELKPSSHS